MANQDEMYMQRCLQLASNGIGYVSPNPMVGCVIVCENKIIGEGYHARYGKEHAEVNAIASVRDKSLLEKSTLYVNLEPCCHHGKTPPCTELILSHKIPQIIVGATDVHSKVSGKGIESLRKNGCSVKIGTLENECKTLNKRFFTYHTKQRPYVILKWAQSLDGYMDIHSRGEKNRKKYWITNEILKYKAHRWRAEEDAVFVGANTILNDNPALNIRYGTGINPIRVSFLKEKISTKSYHFFDNTQQSIVFNFWKEEKIGNTHYFLQKKDEPIVNQILNKLYQLKIQSLIVEGGRFVLEQFLESGFWDEARVLIGNNYFGQGLEAPILPFSPLKEENMDKDKILYFDSSFSKSLQF